MFIQIFLKIVIWSEVECDTEATKSPMMDTRPPHGVTSDANNNGMINQNDEVYAGPATSNDVFNLIPSTDRRKPVRKHFELFLSKLGPFGNLFLNVKKGGNSIGQEALRPTLTPVFQPAVIGSIWQDAQGPQQDAALKPTHQHQHDFIQAVNILQQQQLQPIYQTVRPSLDLSIKGPPIPDIQPLINALPGVLITGYKSFLDKVSSTSFVWNKAINLPFLSIKKSGKFGTSTTGPMASLPTDGIVNGQINTLIDIRDQYAENI